MKIKITYQGQSCRKCKTPVIKKIPTSKFRGGEYYYDYYLKCPKCMTMYMVESAKHFINAAQLPF